MGIKFDNHSNLDKVLSAEEEALERAMEMIGMQMEGYAKEELTASGAVDTGRLRASVSHSSSDKEVVVGTNVEYGPYIEFGTSKMAPRPYLRPTVQGHHDEYRNMVLSQLKG